MREAISSVSQRHGATATFLPKPFQESAGSGGHIHVSMQDSNNQNIMGGILASLQGEGSIGESFMAGPHTVCHLWVGWGFFGGGGSGLRRWMACAMRPLLVWLLLSFCFRRVGEWGIRGFLRLSE